MTIRGFIFGPDGIRTDTAVGLGPSERVGQADMIPPNLSGVKLSDILETLNK